MLPRFRATPRCPLPAQEAAPKGGGVPPALARIRQLVRAQLRPPAGCLEAVLGAAERAGLSKPEPEALWSAICRVGGWEEWVNGQVEGLPSPSPAKGGAARRRLSQWAPCNRVPAPSTILPALPCCPQLLLPPAAACCHLLRLLHALSSAVTRPHFPRCHPLPPAHTFPSPPPSGLGVQVERPGLAEPEGAGRARRRPLHGGAAAAGGAGGRVWVMCALPCTLPAWVCCCSRWGREGVGG